MDTGGVREGERQTDRQTVRVIGIVREFFSVHLHRQQKGLLFKEPEARIIVLDIRMQFAV